MAYSPRFYVEPQEPALPRPPELPALVTLGHPRLARPSDPVDPAQIGTPDF